MKKIMIIFISLLAAPAFATKITVSVPACFMTEFAALESAIGKIKKEAKVFCSQKTRRNSEISISTTNVERSVDADCDGFVVTAEVACFPTSSSR